MAITFILGLGMRKSVHIMSTKIEISFVTSGYIVKYSDAVNA